MPEHSRIDKAKEFLGDAKKSSEIVKKAAQKSKEKADIPAAQEKTALVLSGGAARGAYEMGVWQALTELGVQIDMVCGTSIGAMNAYIVALGSYEKARDMWLSMKTEEVFDFDHALQEGGGRFTGIKDILMADFPEDEVRASKTDFGLCTVKLNEEGSMDPDTWTPLYLWKEDIPEGKLMDYVLASCSCYPVVKPYEIDGTKYLDGGFYDYIPVRMALDKGAERIIAVNLEAVGLVQGGDIEKAGARLTMIEPSDELGNFVVFDPANTRRIMRMGYLDTMKIYGAFDGQRYTFMKGSMDQRSLAAAERTGEIFGLDSGVIYSKQSYRNALLNEIDECRNALDTKNLDVDLKKLWEKKLSWKAIKVGLENVGEYSRQSVFLGLCDTVKKQTAERPLAEAAARGSVGKDFNAALWAVKNGLV
ncbi:MAG: patatin-like phospholipase family protein [Firmicutes bacterium]|nr:patatin-like phospholipase family protein [Bacillota bacterium]